MASSSACIWNLLPIAFHRTSADLRVPLGLDFFTLVCKRRQFLRRRWSAVCFMACFSLQAKISVPRALDLREGEWQVSLWGHLHFRNPEVQGGGRKILGFFQLSFPGVEPRPHEPDKEWSGCQWSLHSTLEAGHKQGVPTSQLYSPGT